MTLIFPFLFPPYGVYAFRFDRINELIDDRRVTRFDETNFFIGITCPFSLTESMKRESLKIGFRLHKRIHKMND